MLASDVIFKGTWSFELSAAAFEGASMRAEGRVGGDVSLHFRVETEHLLAIGNGANKFFVFSVLY